MEDQGKRLMLAVGIAFGIMLIWTALFPAEKPLEKQAEKPAAVESQRAAARNSSRSRGDAPTPKVKGPAEGDSTGKAEPAVAGKANLSNSGVAEPGAVVAPAVAEPGAVVAPAVVAPAVAEPGAVVAPAVVAPAVVRGEERFFDFEFQNIHVQFSSYGAALTKYELLLPRLRSLKDGTPDNMIRVSDDAYRNLRIWFEDSTFNVPRDAEWKGEKVGADTLRFTWESADIRVVKEIVFHPKSYLMLVNVSVELVGAESASQALAISTYAVQDPTVGKAGMFKRVSRAWKAACYQDEEVKTTTSKELAAKGEKRRTGEISWGGFDYPYLLSAISMADNPGERIDCNAYPLDDVVGGMGVDMVQEKVELKKGEPGLRSSVAIYMGPKYRHLLREAAVEATMDAKFENSVNLGFLGIIAGPLLSLLNFFQSLVVNWGLAILLLTIVVKGLTLPWTHKSMVSMKAMAKLKPQLEKIKEKFKEDKARQQAETMNLFKAHKVNPMSGCLPMLLQMPIWFALYRSLTVASELYQAPFISGWIDDLTLPDPYHVMPVMLTGMMFLQTKLTPSTGSGAQQKMLMYGMPIMFGAFSFFFPAGLTLYIFTNTCFTALHHLYMRKEEAKSGSAGPVAAAAIIDVDSNDEKSSGSVQKSEKNFDTDTDESDSKSTNPTKSGKSKKKSGQSKKKRKR